MGKDHNGCQVAPKNKWIWHALSLPLATEAEVGRVWNRTMRPEIKQVLNFFRLTTE